MAILVVAEHDNTWLKPDTAKVVACAQAIGGDIDVLVAGHDCSPVVAKVKQLSGVRRVLVADARQYEHCTADNFADLVVSIADDYRHILASASSLGKDLLPRIAALLDVAQLSEVIEVISEDIFIRPIYAGSVLATIQSLDPIKVMTVRAAAFSAVTNTGTAAVKNIEPLSCSIVKLLSHSLTKTERPDLNVASVVVSGGSSMGGVENFSLLEQLADKLGGAVGASRTAVDAGYVSNDLQVGQSGKIVAPDLYIAIGISGAVQHLAGMKDSKVIVAINKDAQAPIFQVADYGLVADLFEALPEFIKQV